LIVIFKAGNITVHSPPERNGFPLYMVATLREGVAREAVQR